MKDIKRYWGVFAIVLVALLSSCGSPKSYTYLQDVELMKRYAVEKDREIKIEPGDRLSIHVGSAFPELAAPLNGGGYPKVGAGASASSSSDGGVNQREMSNYGYMVDPDGTINFPLLGRVPVAGLTAQQVARSLERRIVESKSLTDPRVSVAISNFKIYLLGAIAGQGGDGLESTGNWNSSEGSTFSRLPGVQGGMLKVYDKTELNLLEAIAMVGDLPQKARVDHVNVLRKGEDGAFVTYRVNLKSADLFYSPAFYLKQNDIVYVEYRYRRTQTLDRAMQLSGYFFSTVASVAALVALLKK